ncbi:hypothetical protein NPIL_1141 [Nephila pilipes]|uniref:Uncharacterized protein n=1 Tax=Nephila pilipes TaxID=299642 RepID=A0A8X6NK89_NEPPI|nr:hypothetical protein NPIL_1141 [Nephila pilipes]
MPETNPAEKQPLGVGGYLRESNLPSTVNFKAVSNLPGRVSSPSGVAAALALRLHIPKSRKRGESINESGEFKGAWDAEECSGRENHRRFYVVHPLISIGVSVVRNTRVNIVWMVKPTKVASSEAERKPTREYFGRWY